MVGRSLSLTRTIPLIYLFFYGSLLGLGLARYLHPRSAFAGSEGRAGIIVTVAGHGENGFGGDGLSALDARLASSLFSMAADSSGDLYIADADNNRIRRIGADGRISTVAGNGSGRFSGDGGLATRAALFHPRGVAVDRSGAVYIADTRNHRIRKVERDGIIRTVAGDGEPGSGGDGGPAIRASLNRPGWVSLDSCGRLFIGDRGGRRIRRIDPDGTIHAVAVLSFPSGIAIDPAGDLFYSDILHHRVRERTRRGEVVTVAGTGTAGDAGDGGPAVRAELEGPGGLAVDGAGDLFIADAWSNRIRRVDPQGGIVTVAGGPSDPFDNGGFSGDGGPAVAALLEHPTAVAADRAGNLFIADSANHRVRRVCGVAAQDRIAGMRHPS